MKLTVIKTPLPDLLVIETQRFQDNRGFFMETWNRRDFEEAGISADFIQDNHSHSKKGVIRGMHYQSGINAQTKLVRCIYGKIYDVAVDLRVGSPTFGKWHGVELSATDEKSFFVPIGFAHGIAALSSHAEITYKVVGLYDPASEGTIKWNDPDIDIKWPIKNPILADKDMNGQSLQEYIKKPAFFYKK